MAFVNRSNHVADVLKSTGRFVGFDEMLNDTVIRHLAPQYGVSTLSAYIEKVLSQQVKYAGQVWGVKAGSAQLAMLLRYGIIANILRPSVIRVRRRDIVAQAISMMIAEQTRQWTSLDEKSDTETQYDGQRIVHHIRSISNSYALLDQVVATVGLPVFDIVYEEFLDRPHDIVSDLGLKLIGQSVVPQMDKLQLTPQRNDINIEFRNRFVAESGSIIWEAQ
jgi:LPS sulfotransferase NodH